MKHILFLVALMGSIGSPAQMNWQLRTSPVSQDLTSIRFYNNSFGIAVGLNNSMIRTTNGGTSWSAISPQPGSFRDVYLSSTTICYAVGDGGKIEKSTNGGSGWVNQTSGVTDTLFGVWFTDALTGFVCGDSGTVLATLNGGVNWTTVNVPVSDRLYDVVFTDAVTGYMCGANGVLLKTTNGGSVWSVENSATTEDLHAICFQSSTYGFACGENGEIIRTTDGINWLHQYSTTSVTLRDIEFNSLGNIYAVGDSTFSVHSVNGGSIWQLMVGLTDPGCGLAFTSSTQAYCVGEGGMINRTVTGWGRYNNATADVPYINDVFFTDSLHGYACGTGVIMKTIDGIRWSTTAFASNQNFVSIYFPDSAVGYAGTDAQQLYKTTDAGVSWQQITSPPTSSLHALYFISADTGFFCGYRLLKTTDGGASWDTSVFVNGDVDNILGMTFTSPDSGFCYDDFGVLCRTMDGGATWHNCFVRAGENFAGVSFPSPNIGYLAEDVHVYKTTDAGQNWFPVNFPSAGDITDICFTSNQVGYLSAESSGGYAVVYNTTNGGITWGGGTVPSSSFSIALAVHFPDQRHGYVVSNDNDTTSCNIGAYHTQDYSVQASVPTITDPSIRTYAPDWDWTHENRNGREFTVYPSGESVVAGTFYQTMQIDTVVFNTSDYGIVITRYDTAGHLIWARHVGGFTLGEVKDIAVDSSENIYITGYFRTSAYFSSNNFTTPASSPRIFVAKFSPAGILVWVKNYGDSGGGAQQGQTICVTPLQTVVVGGWCQTAFNFGSLPMPWYPVGRNFFVLGLSTAGTEQWLCPGWTSGSINYAEITNSSSDPNGNVYVCGTFNDSIAFGTMAIAEPAFSYSTACKGFVAKYNSAGVVQWIRAAGGLDDVEYNAVAADSGGSVYTGGYLKYTARFGNIYTSAHCGMDMLLVKYDAMGNELWAKTDGGSSEDYIGEIIIGRDGSVYAGAHMQGGCTIADTSFTCASNSNFSIIAYSSLGQCMWIKSVRMNSGPLGDPIFFTEVNGLGLDSADNLYGHVKVTDCFIDSVIYGGLIFKLNPDNAVSGVGIIPSEEDQTNFILYPNPAHSTVTLITGTTNQCNYSIVDVMGQTVIAGTSGSDKTQIDISTLSSGLYFVVVQSGARVHYEPLIIER